MLRKTAVDIVMMGWMFLSLWAGGPLVQETQAQDTQAFPVPASIKGLQVQMVDDALALGVQHAALNLALNGLLTDADDGRAITWTSQGRSYKFARAYVEALDRQIQPLSDAGVVVYLIVLMMPSGHAEHDQRLLHPQVDARGKYTVAAFNTATEAGRDWLRAALEFLAHRYSGIQTQHGRVWGWILGNEVNSHFMWYNRGPCQLDELTDSYEQALRIAHQALRQSSTHARLYISLDHHWSSAHTPDQPTASVPGRDLLDALASLARQRGDFDWHIAYHPYHSNLFSSELWNDPLARSEPATPNITFYNLEVLCQYLQRPELLWNGQSRRLILSEQGFHSPPNAEGELQQAAAYAYAWEKCQRWPQVEAFIYHRHVDHAHEGGLRLGLWRNRPGSIATPESTKPIYDLFRKAGTSDWDTAARTLLPVTGLTGWDALK